MFESPLFSLAPVEFFALSADCRYLPGKGRLSKDFELPKTGALCHEKAFATIAMGWNEEGLRFLVEVDQPTSRSSYPQLQKGDSVELFIDTRDVKTSGFNTRFCHHFFFLAETVDEHWCGEMTHFRTDDRHPICDAQTLKSETKKKRDSYEMHLFIPASCLHGYDPSQFNRLGFTYRINRAGGAPQHFSAVSKDFQIEQQPSLWASLLLTPK
ncbi:MAG: hypothetical protein LW832_01615 [Parachlamydia sp.]|jgi:hypothetical protein|nr:hypothetical protein [Parachlamydia sp.]